MFCFRCLGTIPNVSRHVTQRIQPQTVKAVSGIPSRTNPQSTTTTFRQSSRLLTTTTAGTTFPSQLTRFSSSPFSILRTTSSAFPSSSSSLSSPATSLPSSTRSFSATPYLGVKRDTYNPSRRVQKRRHGFLARLKTRAGRKILKRRQVKGRKNMSW